MNPLIETCKEITRCGYEKSEHWHPKVNIRELQLLGNRILNHSGLGQTFHLSNHGSQNAYSDKDKAVCIMYGSGVDSFCALHHALQDDTPDKPGCIYVVHTDYGQPYWRGESDAFERTKYATRPNNCTIDWRRRMEIIVPPDATNLDWENYIIPGRNLVLAAIGSEYAPRIWIVATKRGNPKIGTPDKTRHFFINASSAFTRFYGYRVEVQTPFEYKTKREVVVDYLSHGGELKTLADNTFSCYSPVNEVEHCGTCLACYKRFQLLQSFDYEYNFVTHPQHGKNFKAFQAREALKAESA